LMSFFVQQVRNDKIECKQVGRNSIDKEFI
jgi:hypothetical protein